MEKILITGAGGFIGSSLWGYLKNRGYKGKVIGIDLPDLDLADGKAVMWFLEDCRPSRIVHLAASLARQEDEAGRAQQWRSTFQAGRNLLEAAVAMKVPHLIMAGTIDELGRQGGVLTPDFPAQPRTTYGLCKSLLREVAEFYTRREVLRLDWFRPFTVYGPGQKGTMLIPYAFQMAREGRPAEFTDGRQIRDFLYIDDLLEWLRLALQVNLTRCLQGEFHLHHLGSQAGTSVAKVLELIAAEFPGATFHLGIRRRPAHEPDVQMAPRYSSSDFPLDGWKSNISCQEGVAKTAHWWKTKN